jgi:hypothetical protein
VCVVCIQHGSIEPYSNRDVQREGKICE